MGGRKTLVLALVVALAVIGALILSTYNGPSPSTTATSTPMQGTSTTTETGLPPTSTTSPQEQGQGGETVFKSFTSYGELVEYLEKKSETGYYYGIYGVVTGQSIVYIGSAPTSTQPPSITATPVAVTVAESPEPSGKTGGVSYSRTNIQVSGVDEADIVKSDGEYIYIVKGDKVYIVKAYPPDQLRIMSTISLAGNYNSTSTNNTGFIEKHSINIKGIYLYDNKLVILAEEYSYRIIPSEIVITPSTIPPTTTEPANNELESSPTTTTVTIATTTTLAVPPQPTPQLIPLIGVEKTLILVYDIEDKSDPKPLYNISISGSYKSSRLIDKYLYVISSMPTRIYDYREKKYHILVPTVNGENLTPDKIYYPADTNIAGPAYTIILALDLDSGNHSEQAIIQGFADRIYMSKKNLYILVESMPDMNATFREVLEEIQPYLPEDLRRIVENALSGNESVDASLVDKLSQWFESLPAEKQAEIIRRIYKTIISKISLIETAIYKFTVDGLKLNLVAASKVPGRILDQFAMDEYKGYFRIVTTVAKPVLVNVTYKPHVDIRFNTTNNVYILDENLNVVGSLEALAPSEQVYSARFIGDILFLVTYRRVDPLYAINLTDPEKPEIIGYVKIPGYSEYLHPFKNNLLIGIGVESDEQGRWLGLKISVFNITDLRNVSEVSTIVLREAVMSPVLYDHHAFVLNYEENYMLVPLISEPWSTNGSGVYMVTIDPETGDLAVRGHIALENPRRALYIGDYIYAIGYGKLVVANEDMRVASSITLG